MAVSSLSLLLLCLFVFPLVGAWLSKQSLHEFLVFPPKPIPVDPGEVSWILFVASSLCIALVVFPFILRLLSFRPTSSVRTIPKRFPLWGWLAAGNLFVFWVLAWNRFDWVGEFQLHTFTPLWVSYVVVVNALTDMRTQRCLLRNQPRLFSYLFILSAMFWWVFEYLNRFTKNWNYLPEINVDGFTYFWVGSLSFSTVLPAVYCTHELLMSFPWLSEPFKSWRSLRFPIRDAWKWSFFILACVGLLGIGVWPKLFYPLIWISPLLLLLLLQNKQNRMGLFDRLEQGDWRPVVIPAMAGFLCGILWELWNFQSLAHWEYAIPFLRAYEIFEMPILGYAGYFPFGLTCVVSVQLLMITALPEMAREKSKQKSSVSLKMPWQTPSHHTRNI